MKKLRLPGFTAHQSLYEDGQHFAGRVVKGISSRDVVFPQSKSSRFPIFCSKIGGVDFCCMWNCSPFFGCRCVECRWGKDSMPCPVESGAR
jgi:hypothetical protein